MCVIAVIDVSRTGRAVGVISRERHLGFEVATVVHRVWVDDDKGDAPFEDVLVDKLRCNQ